MRDARFETLRFELARIARGWRARGGHGLTAGSGSALDTCGTRPPGGPGRFRGVLEASSRPICRSQVRGTEPGGAGSRSEVQNQLCDIRELPNPCR